MLSTKEKLFPMQSQTVQVNGQTIALPTTSGRGPAVLLIHGNSASGRSFLHQLNSPLGERCRLIALDLPGHGQYDNAPDPSSVYTLPGYAQIVVAVVNQLALEQVISVGWSLGGHIALEAEPLLPQVAGLLIFGTPPLAFPPAMAEAFLPHPAMGAAFKADLTDAEMDGYVQAFFQPGVTELPEAFRADVRRTDGRARATMAASIQPNGYRDEVAIVANLTKPLAVLQGEHEQLINLAYLQSLPMPTLWRKAVQVIPAAGHAPHWEQPEQFNRLLAEFVQEGIAS